MNQQGIDRFNDAVQALLLAHPFFGTLLMKLKHEPVACGTLFVDGRRMGYDPDFMAQQDPEQAIFCVAHEVMHVAWMHLDRLRHYLDRGIGPDGKPLDTHLFNMALDYPNNDSLVASRVGKPPAGIQICLDPHRFPHTMTPEEVYCELRAEQEAGGNGGGSGTAQPLDDHRPPAAGEQGDGITKADVIQAANVCKAMRGKLPAGIDRLLGEIKKPSVSPWRRLRQAVTSATSGRDRSTWRRLQRRMVVRGVGMPGLIAEGAGHVGVVVDTSGSIGQDMLNLFGGHMAAILDDARPKHITLFWTDAVVHRTDKVNSPSQLRAVLSKKVPGGGGTDMRRGVQAAEEAGCDAIVVLTDGYTPFCDAKGKLIWAITTQQRSPYGETIHIGGA